jgi:predicted small secreted protein
MKNKVRTMKTLILIAALTALSACATVEGAGRDISAGASTVGGWLGAGG